MSRRGRVYRRCGSCCLTVTDRKCGCGSDRTGWAFAIDVAPIGGRRRRVSRSGFDTKRAAQTAMAEVQVESAHGQYIEPSRQQLGAWLQREWLPAAESRLRPATWRSYQDVLRLHVIDEGHRLECSLGSTPMRAIDVASLNGLYAELLRRGRADGRGGLSPRTVQYVHRILAKALDDAVTWGLLSTNPARHASGPRPTTPARQIDTWTADQLRSFLELTRADRLYPLWHLASSTGMRRGELLGLRWRDVDLETEWISVSQARISVNYEVSTSAPKTARSRRQIAIDKRTVAVLRAWRSAQLHERMAWGPAWTDSGLVFTRENGEGWHPDRISTLFGQAVRTSDLPRVRLHDLRHGHATMALRAGIHPKVVSERLGHSTIALTLDTYSHAIPAMQADAAQKIANLVWTE